MKVFYIFLCLVTTTVGAVESLTFESGKQQTTLIELYTSEGCSSCPPADLWLARFKNDQRLWQQFIPIAFHVDYWDYIGWKDPFAKHENTLRQNLHQQQDNISTVYTPGFVIDGKEWRGFFERETLSLSKKPEVGVLKAVITGDKLTVNFNAEQQPLDFNIAILGFDLQTSVKRGENAGRLLKHEFVALEHYEIQSANNQVELKIPNIDALSKQNQGIAIWVSKTNSLVPIQAVGGRLGSLAK